MIKIRIIQYIINYVKGIGYALFVLLYSIFMPIIFLYHLIIYLTKGKKAIDEMIKKNSPEGRLKERHKKLKEYREKHYSKEQLEIFNINKEKITELYENIKQQEWSKELKSFDANDETTIWLYTKKAPHHDFAAITICYLWDKEEYILSDNWKQRNITGNFRTRIILKNS